MRFCKMCDERVEDEDILCPRCRSLTSKSEDPGPSSKSVRYDDWDPPSIVTIYTKLLNISYSQFKYDTGRGIYPIKLEQIERKLESKEYNCGVCSYNLDGICTKKESCSVSPDAICKSFEVQRKSTSRQHRMPPWYSPR